MLSHEGEQTIELILIIGIAVTIFVGFNIGGSSTGIAWGPAVGANLVSKKGAATLMTLFVFLGGWTVGRNVMGTLGDGIVPSTIFTPEISIAVLFFIGLGILIANIFGVPVPTSMTAVGAIAGLGLASGTLNWEIMGRILSWWLVTPVAAFLIGATVGRYLYPHLDNYLQLEQTPGKLFEIKKRTGKLPKPVLGENTTKKELVSAIMIIIIGCYMAFGAGASNVANAVAPLVGSNTLTTNSGIILATLAISLGGFTIARRTMDSVGNDLTELPLLAALIVASTAATITSLLSWIGIPISLVMATVMTTVGLGWGRASRTATVKQIKQGDKTPELTVDTLTAETPENVPKIGEEEKEDLDTSSNLFNPKAVSKFVSLWIIGPTVSAGLSYLFFTFFLL